MTDQSSPITPPPELVQQLYGLPQMRAIEVAFRAGADQELEACCEWTESYAECGDSLRRHRRPKPPSEADQALTELEQLKQDAYSMGMGFDAPAICRALERLEELEQLND